MNFKGWLEYRGSHKAPGKDYGAPLHDLTPIYPKDVYSNIMQYASDFSQKEASLIILRNKGLPNNIVRVYRAVPKGVSVINVGDWVAITKNYAMSHSRHHTDPDKDLSVIWAETECKNLFTDGNSFEEWGYAGNEPLNGFVLKKTPSLLS